MSCWYMDVTGGTIFLAKKLLQTSYTGQLGLHGTTLLNSEKGLGLTVTSSPTKHSPPIHIQKNTYAKAREIPALKEVHRA